MLHWPRTPVDIAGRRYFLCFTLGAVAEAQSRFDDRGIDVNLLDGLPSLNLANVRILFPAALRKHHQDEVGEAAKRLATFHSVFDIAVALREAWLAASPVKREGEKPAKKEKPPEIISRDLQWQRLWSLAKYDLRLSTEEFYDLTVGQLDSLIQRHERATRDAEFMPAQIAACVVNFSMGRPKEGVKPSDFMPSEWSGKPERAAVEPKRKRSYKVIAAEIDQVMANFLHGADKEAALKDSASWLDGSY